MNIFVYSSLRKAESNENCLNMFRFSRNNFQVKLRINSKQRN